ncbi:MAG: hypothetical protein A2762_05200 [Candidatus Lloydbacteria bacterium RIFCSPHIGHO2_01_FULL_54_11]|nr:MAG: hypothetical protein A2762_05200 [Candidatus Lloydbacteria bacterium RIFCSPHIGHO2_01_FULL_54_11]OGZ16337.1 MAG: hypothetical protein A3H76_03065 [Candidatus Lloydbacteria bacterium RIFCSPLOWO2_02_FULL_54_12]
MEGALLLFLVLLAVVAMAWFLSRIVCPFCKNNRIVPKAGDGEHGFATYFECLACRKTFRLLFSASHRRDGTNE